MGGFYMSEKPYTRAAAKWFKELGDWLEAKGSIKQDLSSKIGTAPQDRTIGEIADVLRLYLKDRPKAP
jgi:hypothetical protein